jgi:hypothetical protein
MQMIPLFDLQIEWIKMYDSLRASCDPDGTKFAAPFLSTPDPDALVCSRRPIMLVGQATKGDWFLREFDKYRDLPIHELAEECREHTSDFQTNGHYSQFKKSDFWRFRRDIKEAIGTSVIWTNLAKIGAQRGNPRGQVLYDQCDLAITTMKAEVREYCPQLVVLVSGGFAVKEIVYPAFDTRRRDEWQEFQLEQEDDYCLLESTKVHPTVLWFNHPRGKSGLVKNRWIEIIRRWVKVE